MSSSWEYPTKATPPGARLRCISGYGGSKTHPKISEGETYTLLTMVRWARSWEAQLVEIGPQSLSGEPCGYALSAFIVIGMPDGADYQTPHDCDLVGDPFTNQIGSDPIRGRRS